MPKVDVAPIAAMFDAEIKEYVAAQPSAPLLVGFLANADPAALMYAKMTRRACERNGVRFELRDVEKFALEEAVIAANADPNVHGILVYYPIFGGALDDYLRDVISFEKDVEGLNHRYRYAMYHNIRHLDDASLQKCVLPCTPLAIVKILEHTGAYDRTKPVGQQLSGKTAIVYNRSEVVGRPLGAMLANDGARVYSVDVTGMLLYSKGRVHGTIKVEETSVSTAEALAEASIVVSGVPSKSFVLAPSGIRPDAICVNFSQHSNFGEGIESHVQQYVPVIGKVTISMLERNLLRLHANFSAAAVKAPANFDKPPSKPAKRERRWTRDGAAEPAMPPLLVAMGALAIGAIIGAAVMRR